MIKTLRIDDSFASTVVVARVWSAEAAAAAAAEESFARPRHEWRAFATLLALASSEMSWRCRRTYRSIYSGWSPGR